MFYNVFSFFYSFVYKFRKQGFTLAEALIITVMTGVCLLPILGTMQNAQVRTEKFDHQSKMQQYARSRLNAEIANAAFDHKSINLDDEFHYIVYFASSTTDESAEAVDAKLIELPKSYVTLEDLASLTLDLDHDNWATAAVNLLGISRDKGAPYLQVVHAYKTSVESKNNPSLAEFGKDSNKIDTPKALLGIVVKTCLIKSNEDFYDPSDGAMVTAFNADGSIKTTDKDSSVLPVTLFSFVNLPTVSDEMIWLADALNCVIYGIDPISRGVTTIPLPRSENHADKPENPNNDPFRPWHIAVHPSLKLLAVMMQEKIVLVNIDSKGPLKYDVKDTILTKTNMGKNICTIDKEFERAYEDGGICFRPDGKVLFFTQTIGKNSSKIYAYELKSYINPTTNVLDWEKGANNTPYFTKLSTSGVSCSLKDDLIVGLKPSNDGFLYVAFKEVPKEKNSHNKKGGMIYRFPMYLSDWSSWDGEEFSYLEDKKYISIDVSPDGNRLAAITETDGLLIEYDTKTKTQIYNPLTIKNGDKMPTPFKNAYVSISDKDTDYTSKKSLSVAVTSKTEIKKSLVGNFESNTSTPFRCSKVASGTEGGFVVVSPDGKNIVANDRKKPWIYFWNTGTTNSEDSLTIENNGISEFLLDTSVTEPKQEKGYTSLETTKRDILAASFANNKIKLYDLNTFKELEDEGFVATYSLSDLVMNNLGNMLLSSHDNNTTGCFQYNITDGSSVNPTVSVYRRKAVFDDSWPNMAFALQYKRNDAGEITNEGFYNLYYSSTDKWETVATDTYDRRDFKINSEWQGLDIIGMPNGGAMALYGKADGSSMLEWIGRRNWGSSNIGKYKLFARWTNIIDSSSISEYLPESTLNAFTNADSSLGGIYRLVTPVKANTIVNSFDVKTANWSGDTKRFVTPILLRKLADGGFLIVNYALNSLSLAKNTEYSNNSINWYNTFNINVDDTYYLGWWSGTVTGQISGGAIGWDPADTGYTCIGDLKLSSGVYGYSNLPGEAIYDNNLKRKYNIRFNVTSVQKNKKSAFPPLFSKKIAISPDCGTLAILSSNDNSSSEEDKVPVLSLFDFNNYNYGPETQIEGMLVDYREPCQSGVWNVNVSSGKTSTWPVEHNFLFKKVDSKCHFQNGQINSFPCATSKNDSWTSFNQYPANYYTSTYEENISGLGDINNSKRIANKRFLGYIRPEYNAKYFQFYGGDDIRFFYNNIILDGRVEQGAYKQWDSNIVINCNSYDSNYLQLDNASNKGPMSYSVFLGKVGAGTLSANVDPNNTDSNMKKNNIVTSSDKWSPLESSETYILNNYPSFIKSYKIVNKPNKLNMNYADMVFSRNRSLPVLYIKGVHKLHLVYKNKVVQVDLADEINESTDTNSKNVIISSDGQKLILGKGNYLRAYNISNFDEDSFKTQNPSISSNAGDYLGKIATIDLKANPKYLVAKPFVSYSSASYGGNYKLKITDNSFKISTNGAVVASGGIYLVNSDSKQIAVYNPMTDDSNIAIKSVMESNCNSSAVTAYNNTLYIFGNSGGQSGEVQSYEIDTGKILKTSVMLDASEYWANPCTYDNWGDNINIVAGNTGSSSGVSPEYAFDSKDQSANKGWRTSSLGVIAEDWWISYGMKQSELAFVVNKIIINNKSQDDDDYCVKDYEFYGVNGSSEKLLTSGTVPQNSSNYSIPFDNSVAYEKYKLKCLSNYGGALVIRKGVAELKLCRNDLKLLTPSASDSIDKSNRSQHVFSWNTSDGNQHIIKTSDITEDNFELCDFYHSNYNNNYYNNANFWSEHDAVQAWCCNKTNPYILLSLSNPEILKVVRYSNFSKDKYYLSAFRLYGSNKNTVSPNPSDTSSEWELLTNRNGGTTFSYGPAMCGTWITREVNNIKPFKHYLFYVISYNDSHIELTGFEMYGERKMICDSLTNMEDDNLNKINVYDATACATPYGLVVAGGRKSSVSAKTLLYWPHAVNKYDGLFYQYGISRSLPDLNCARYKHALVWHKGKIYAIGGLKDSSHFAKNEGSGTSEKAFVEYLDYNSGDIQWQNVPLTSFVFQNTDTVNYNLLRECFGTCSFGDEIFIFGGNTNEEETSIAAYAWNPETKIVRRLTDLPTVLNPCCAVPFGSKIYVMGMDSNSPSKFRIYEYTP